MDCNNCNDAVSRKPRSREIPVRVQLLAAPNSPGPGVGPGNQSRMFPEPRRGDIFIGPGVSRGTSPNPTPSPGGATFL